MLIYEAGGFLGWLTILLFAGTIANYLVKFINKKWGKRISAFPAGKKSMTLMMKVFVRNHRFFGVGAFIALFLHFIIQFLSFGLSISGLIAAVLLILQVAIGAYAAAKKRPRRGAWFAAHRSIAALLILGMAIHLTIPSVIGAASPAPANTTGTYAAELKVFTPDELAEYSGQNGQPAYIAYKGVVYDVSDVPEWKNGTHNGVKAGTDVTGDISRSPHGEKVFAGLPQVGTLQE